MEKVREDFDHIKRALDEMLYYNPEELERQADEYERDMARKEGREEGRKEGRKEGIKEGREEERKKIITNLYNSNLSIDEISNLTRISRDNVENILINKDIN